MKPLVIVAAIVLVGLLGVTIFLTTSNQNGAIAFFGLNSLEDVFITNPTTDNHLVYNGTYWTNQPYTGSTSTGIVPIQPNSFLIHTWTNDTGTFYAAQNGTSGLDLWTSTDAGEILNNTLNINGNNGVKVFIKNGIYAPISKFSINYNHTYLIGETSGVEIISNLLPVFEINGGALDSNMSLMDIEVSNIKFTYNGAVTGGAFVWMHGLQSDYKYQGQCKLSNLSFKTNQTSIPTNVAFIGLYLHDIVGLISDNLNFYMWGYGFYMNSTLQSDILTFNHLQSSYCYRGGYVSTGANRVTFVGLKIMFTSNHGIDLDCRHTTLIAPQFESITGTGLNMGSYEAIIENGEFSAVTSYACFLGASNSNTTILNTVFNNVGTAIVVDGTVYLQGVRYEGTITTKILLDGTKYHLKGTDLINTGSQINSTSTTCAVSVAYAGLTPTSAFASFNDTGITGYTVTGLTATTVTFTIQGTPTGNWMTYWQTSHQL